MTSQKIEEKKFFELCKTGSAEEILAAINTGVNINAEDERGFRPLGYAVIFNKNAGAVRVLLEAGAKFNVENRKFMELVPLATTNPPSHAVIKLLIAHGMLANMKAYDGTTALMLAALSDDLEVMEALLRTGSDVNDARYDGVTALMCAVKKGSPEKVNMFLKAGADVNASDSNGMTALMQAAMNNPNPEVVDLLMKAGAKDVKNKSGKTALMFAAMMNTPEVVNSLIEGGADVNAKDSDGKTAMDYAAENNKLGGGAVLARLEALSRKRG